MTLSDDYIARKAKRTGQDPDRLRAYIEREVAKAPPLSAAQRDTIARLFAQATVSEPQHLDIRAKK